VVILLILLETRKTTDKVEDNKEKKNEADLHFSRKKHVKCIRVFPSRYLVINDISQKEEEEEQVMNKKSRE
jgi:hypothetical protein